MEGCQFRFRSGTKLTGAARREARIAAPAGWREHRTRAGRRAAKPKNAELRTILLLLAPPCEWPGGWWRRCAE